jgi:putative component of membrane protein insertase Oxa1/YidC/SpoIIIJ protein YidD
MRYNDGSLHEHEIVSGMYAVIERIGRCHASHSGTMPPYWYSERTLPNPSEAMCRVM